MQAGQCLSVGSSEPKLSLSIDDNGIGFAPYLILASGP